MKSSDSRSSPVDATGFASVVGIDVGSEQFVYCVCTQEKSQVIKPPELANSQEGSHSLDQALRQLGVSPQRLLIGLEATGRYRENLSQFLQAQGYALWRLASAPDAPICPATRLASQD
jgi:transposase